MPDTIRLFSLAKFDAVGNEGPVAKHAFFDTTQERADEVLIARGLARVPTQKDETEYGPPIPKKKK